MDSRLSFDQIYIKLAKNLSKRSTCSRLKVGAVITSDDYRYVYGLGYNGTGIGLNNACDYPDKPGQCGCLHAECNAIINCNVSRSTPKIVYLTHSPCRNCAKMILNLGNVKRIVYSKDYRDNEGLNTLFGKGIQIQKV